MANWENHRGLQKAAYWKTFRPAKRFSAWTPAANSIWTSHHWHSTTVPSNNGTSLSPGDHISMFKTMTTITGITGLWLFTVYLEKKSNLKIQYLSKITFFNNFSRWLSLLSTRKEKKFWKSSWKTLVYPSNSLKCNKKMGLPKHNGQDLMVII